LRLVGGSDQKELDVSEFVVYVPVEMTGAQRIFKGSGIVSSGGEDGRVMIDYEGEIYGHRAGNNFADRVDRAAGRQTDNYPTVARSWVEPKSIRAIGYYDSERGIVDLFGEEEGELLAAWLGVEVVDPSELTTASNVLHNRKRDYEKAMAVADPGMRQFIRSQGRRLGLV
jgi:hypothetical protein